MITEKKLFAILKKILGNNITEKSTKQNCSKWDSLNHLDILQKLDEVTKGKIDKIPQLASANSIKEIIVILKKKKLIK
jgi:acyl carrier protein